MSALQLFAAMAGCVLALLALNIVTRLWPFWWASYKCSKLPQKVRTGIVSPASFEHDWMLSELVAAGVLQYSQALTMPPGATAAIYAEHKARQAEDGGAK